MKTSSLPSQPTPFIGRAIEIVEITDVLSKPACRLLTLLGPGGIGKTRLALQIAARQSELLCWARQPPRGMGLLVLVEQHPAASQKTIERAMHLRHNFKLQLRPKEMAVITAQAANLDATIPALLAELPTLDLTAPAAEANAPPADPNQALVEPLAGRELEVLRLLAEGLSNQQIAEELTLAEGTIKYYTRQIYAKLQVRGRTQAVNAARDLGLV